jgi:hypothetical protein
MQKTLSSNWKISKDFQNLAKTNKHNIGYSPKPFGDFIEKPNHLGFDIISFVGVRN